MQIVIIVVDTVISIHALLAESDSRQNILCVVSVYFYPRSPCGERLIEFRKLLHPSYFYPRSPCGERRPRPQPPKARFLFLSTLSLRRATHHLSKYQNLGRHFYPRSPCGERRAGDMYQYEHYEISIHALLAESDHSRGLNRAEVIKISIHALLAESDIPWLPLCLQTFHFYPRSPCGERR